MENKTTGKLGLLYPPWSVREEKNQEPTTILSITCILQNALSQNDLSYRIEDQWETAHESLFKEVG